MASSTPSMQELLEAGVHFGHQVRRGHPRMKPYIYGARDGVHIIDLAKSEDFLKQAIEVAYNLGKEGKVMMVVATKKQARSIAEDLAKEVDTPYLTSHWVGGLLTNFDEVRKNFKKVMDLKEEQQKGKLNRTKREQLLIDRKTGKFDTLFSGIADLEKVPDALFVIDAVAESVAVKEANKMGITIIAFADTNSDPTLMDHPIPANDDGIKAIKIISEAVIRSYGEGKRAGGIAMKATAAPQPTEPKKSKKDQKEEVAEENLDEPVAEEAAAIEEEIEKQVVDESSRSEGRLKDKE